MQDGTIGEVLNKIIAALAALTNKKEKEETRIAKAKKILYNLTPTSVDLAIQKTKEELELKLTEKLTPRKEKLNMNPAYSPIEKFGTHPLERAHLRYMAKVLEMKNTIEGRITVESALTAVKETFEDYRQRNIHLSAKAVEDLVKTALPLKMKEDFERFLKKMSLEEAWTTTIHYHSTHPPPFVARCQLTEMTKKIDMPWQDTINKILQLSNFAFPCDGEEGEMRAVETARNYFHHYLKDPCAIVNLFQPVKGCEKSMWASMRRNALEMNEYIEEERKKALAAGNKTSSPVKQKIKVTVKELIAQPLQMKTKEHQCLLCKSSRNDPTHHWRNCHVYPGQKPRRTTCLCLLGHHGMNTCLDQHLWPEDSKLAIEFK